MQSAEEPTECFLKLQAEVYVCYVEGKSCKGRRSSACSKQVQMGGTVSYVYHSSTQGKPIIPHGPKAAFCLTAW